MGIKIKFKVVASLAIGFLSINLGIGVANEAMKKMESYYLGDPMNQTVVSLTTSFGDEPISVSLIKDSLNDIEDKIPISIGPYLLSDIEVKEGNVSVGAFFLNSVVNKGTKEIHEKLYSDNNTNNIVLGKDIYKRFEEDTFDFRDNKYKVKGVVSSKFEKQRINRNIFLSLDDMDKVLVEPYLSKEPFFVEVIFNGTKSEEMAEKFIDNVNKLKGDQFIDTKKYNYDENYKESINPSSYVIIGFSIMIFILTIINLWLLTSITIKQSYGNFAILKSIGSSEKMIAIDFIKKLILNIVIATIVGFIGFLLAQFALHKLLGIGIYTSFNNITITILVYVVVCVIASIKPYYQIKNLNIVTYIKS